MTTTLTFGMKLRTFVVGLLLGAAVPALAQDAVPPPPPPPPDAPAHQTFDKDGFKQRILEKVMEVKHEKLREQLLMDDETAKKFFAIYDPAEKNMISLIKDRQQEEIKLLKLTQGDNNDAEIDQAMQNIKAINRKLLDQSDQLDNNLKTVLNPRQREKLAVFEKKFNQQVREKVRNRVQEWKENHPGKHPFRNKGGAKLNRPSTK
jgi:Spy/CpxP family protein refolding chaperone